MLVHWSETTGNCEGEIITTLGADVCWSIIQVWERQRFFGWSWGDMCKTTVAWNYVAFNSALPNQELSVLYGGPTLIYGWQLSMYFPHMFRVNMTRDLAYLQLSDLQREIRRICRTSVLQGENVFIRRT